MDERNQNLNGRHTEGDLTPKLHELRFLKSKIPQLRRNAAKQSKKLVVNGMVDPIPCVICGTTFDRYNHGKEKHENCRSCRSKLESGQTCLISLVDAKGFYDGRYAWVQSDGTPMAEKLKGLVIGVKPTTMDKILGKKAEDDNG
jgi:hypothetical protein